MSPPHDRVATRRRNGFTLVELLVVIGIIAVLAGLLLTVRSRASTKAAQVNCLNNLRQLGMAMVNYAQNNDQAFPFAAPLNNAPAGDKPEDWIHWQVGGDETKLTDDINNSAIAPYVGARGTGFQALMRCPADEVENHKKHAVAQNAYRYSYTMNFFLSSDKLHPRSGGRWNGGATPRVTAIARPSEKILLAEENELSINDGLWEGGIYASEANRTSWTIPAGGDYLSIRHDTKKGEFSEVKTGLPERTKRGNVVFVDGHADFVARLYAHNPKNLLPSNEGTGVVP